MLTTLLALFVAGKATFYNPGWTEEVLANRLAWGHVQPCAECIGYVALLEPEHIGKRVWLRRPGLPAEGPFLVFDCGPTAPAAKARLQRSGWAVDVDNATAQRWGMRGPIPVEVLVETDDAPDGTGGMQPADTGDRGSR